MAFDFNRRERWKEKSEDKRAPRLYRPRTSVVHGTKLAYSSAASTAIHGESRPSEAVDPIKPSQQKGSE